MRDVRAFLMDASVVRVDEGEDIQIDEFAVLLHTDDVNNNGYPKCPTMLGRTTMRACKNTRHRRGIVALGPAPIPPRPAPPLAFTRARLALAGAAKRSYIFMHVDKAAARAVLEEVPDNLQDMIASSEDKHTRTHRGVRKRGRISSGPSSPAIDFVRRPCLPIRHTLLL